MKQLSSSVRGDCDNTATHHVTSAMEVFRFYCSAANDEITATVDESIAQTYAPEATRTGTESGPAPTGGNGGDSEGQDGDGDDNSDGGGNQTATIAASVMGAVIGVALIAGAIWWNRRRRQKAKAGPTEPPSAPPSLSQRPELHGSHSPTEMSKAGTPVVAEQQHPRAPELGGRDVAEMGQAQPTPELMSYSRADQYVQPAHEMYSPPSHTNGGSNPPQVTQDPLLRESQPQSGMTWQSGPVDAYDMSMRPAH